jgi:ParB-like chromosome segregation protein Spo0J
MLEPSGKNHNEEQHESDCGAPHVQATIRFVEQELRELMRQRAEIAKRVGTIKKTISGLSLLLGDKLPNDLREFKREPSKSRRWARSHHVKQPSERTLQT